MPNIFAILEIGKRAMQTQQVAMQTSNHNIANANTPGFSRQEAFITATESLPAGDISSMGAQLQLGTGTRIATVERLRDVFIDTRIREITQRLGYAQKKLEGLDLIEVIFNELTETVDINSILSEFWNAWDSLAQDPSELATRIDLRQKGDSLSADIRYLYAQLQQLRPSSDEEIKIKINDINSHARLIAELNKEISSVASTGGAANDLEDRRDLLIDELSSLTNIEVSRLETGTLNVSIGGTPLVQGNDANQLSADIQEEFDDAFITIMSEADGNRVHIVSGEVAGLLEVRDEIIPGLMSQLDNLVAAVIEEVNSQHQVGYGLKGSTGVNFFEPFVPSMSGSNKGAAAQMRVSDDIIADVGNIAAGKADAVGDNENALAISALRNKNVLEGETLTFDAYYNRIITNIGSKTEESRLSALSADSILEQLLNRRESVSGVSLDEELVNVIRFQHVYNAAARLITIVDEMMTTVIEKTGITR